MNAAERDRAVAQGLDRYRAGLLDQATDLLDRVLALRPDDAEALDLSGLVAIARGDFVQAIVRTGKAARLQASPRYHSNFGVALGHAGRHEEALTAYRQALALRPAYPEAHNNLGISLRSLGQLQAAQAAFSEALALRPDYADALMNLADTLQSLGRLGEAVAAYQQALALSPGASRSTFGQALRRLGRAEAAIEAYRTDVKHRPDDPDALNNLAAVLADAHNAGEASGSEPISSSELTRRRRGRLEEAAGYCRRAIVLRPDFQEAHSNLGNILRWLDRLTEAETALRRAIALRPSDAGAYNNLGLVLQEMDRHDEARAVLELAIGLAPEDADIHYSLATGLLRQGRLEEGWAEYDWRFRINQAGGSLNAFRINPPWRGEPAAGKTLLLTAEQGLGDTLQFARYIPLMTERGLRIVVAAQAALLRTLRTLPGVAEGLVEVIDQIGNYPSYDLHCPMLSLPRAFNTTLETVPAAIPYLSVPSDVLAHWADHPALRRSTGDERVRVGLVWGGNTRHVNDTRRSLPLETLAPLLRLPGVQWFSLQVGNRSLELQSAALDLPPDDGIVDLSSQLVDFADTAAVVSQLDLVISADTGVAHLAGALGKAVWVMLPRSPDWRWLISGSRTPWYPSMRLFRQDQTRNWPSVVAQLTDALQGVLLEQGHAKGLRPII